MINYYSRKTTLIGNQVIHLFLYELVKYSKNRKPCDKQMVQFSSFELKMNYFKS